jgi:hypothetical protein
MFARSNSRYNNFQTSITTAAAQAHDAAITRPCVYRGASVKVSKLNPTRLHTEMAYLAIGTIGCPGN